MERLVQELDSYRPHDWFPYQGWSSNKASGPLGRRAIIRKLQLSVTSAAPQANRPWVLTFERQKPQRIEPLMGWTSDNDPMVQVRLSFPTREAAVAYAERQGLDYRILDDHEVKPQQSSLGERIVWSNALMGVALQRDSTLPEGLERALVSPSSVFRSPAEVLGHPQLGIGQKWEILRRWAWDEYLQELATEEAMPAAETPSRLEEVRTAMLQLEEFVRHALGPTSVPSEGRR
ncbi:MAG TPA: NADH dehydrogenase ubiquinone Fe-S protein 4 [Devosia sp.]